MVALAVALLRQHRWAYAGLAAVTFASSVVVGSSFMLVNAASTSELPLAGLNANETAKLIGLAMSGRFMASFMAFLSGFVAVMLVTQAISFVIEGRRNELALLRLVGASSRQISLLVAGESIVVGAASSLIGSIIAIPLSGPYSELLIRQQNWPPGLAVSIQAAPLVWCVVVMAGISGVGAYIAARRIAQIPPIEAVHPVEPFPRRMPTFRWIAAGTGVILAVVGLTIPPRQLDPQVSTSLVAAGALIMVSALAPLLLPAVARALGVVFGGLLPAAGLIASKQVAHSAKRAASLGTPIIVLLALGAVFGMMAQTGRAESADGLRQIENADAVLQVEHGPNGPNDFAEATHSAQVGSATNVQRADDWAWANSDMPPDDFPQLMGVDPATISHFVPLDFTAGNLSQVQGTDVALVGGHGQVGDTYSMQSPAGEIVTVQVAARVASSSFVYGTFLVDSEALNLKAGLSDQTWFVEASAGTTRAQLYASLTASNAALTPLSHADWVVERVSTAVANQRSAIFTLVGGGAVVALFSLGQSILASTRERQRELRLLKNLGAGNHSVVSAIVLESTAVVITAAILGSVVAAAAYLRMWTGLSGIGSDSSPVIPIGLLSTVLLACLGVAVGASVSGARVALRAIRRQSRGAALT